MELSNFSSKIKFFLNIKITNFVTKILSIIDQIGYTKKTQNFTNNNSSKLFLSVVIWGDEYYEIFNKILIPSILQPNNIPKLNEFGTKISLYIYTKDNKDPLTQKNLEHLNELISIKIIKNFHQEKNSKLYLNRCLLNFIDESIKNDAVSMVLTADHVYGDYSISRLYNSIKDKTYGLAVASPRINWKDSKNVISDIFLNKKILTNKILTKISIENLHECFKQYITNSNDLSDGFNIKKDSENVFIVTSSRINICAIKFNQFDKNFFKIFRDYNNIDFFGLDI